MRMDEYTKTPLLDTRMYNLGANYLFHHSYRPTHLWLLNLPCIARPSSAISQAKQGGSVYCLILGLSLIHLGLS